MSWSWTRIPVSPPDVLSAMDTFSVGSSWHEAELIADWTPSNTYLMWAQECLKQNSPLGFDSAVCYAKRAVCRQVDAFMVNNHLGRFLGESYPEKLAMLSEVGLCVPDILHELVIGPRNEIEHEYRPSTEEQAKRAVQLVILFLGATAEDAKRRAVLSYSWSINFGASFRDTPEGQIEKVEFSLRPEGHPMLMVDVCDPNNHEVLILRPKDSEILACPMKDFGRADAIEFAKRLRSQCLTDSFSCSTYEIRWLRLLREQLNLPTV